MLQISRKQSDLLAAISSRRYEEIFLIGPLGSNKTFGAAYAMINIAYQFAGSYIPVARKTLAEARIGTVLTFLEVLDAMGLVPGADYRLVTGGEIKIRFTHNASIIQFIQLDHTKDRDWQKVKSINATAAMVDEVDGVQYSGYVMLSSRIGRKNLSGAPAVIVSTCNPNDGWAKEQVYVPWKSGSLEAKRCVIEFEMIDSFLYSSGYYDRFKGNPPQWKQRYLYNNWDYQDDDTSIFKSRLLDSIHVDTYDVDATGFLGVDVAREGVDRSVLSEWRGGVLVNIQIYTREDIHRLALPHERDALPYSIVLGREVIKYATAKGIGYQNISCDAVGNGGGLVDYLRSEGWKVNEFKAGGRPIAVEGARDRRVSPIGSDYDMLRSQLLHYLALEMERGNVKLFDGCPHLVELKQELLYHLFEVQDKVMKVESKDQLKKRLGKSPDIADSVTIGFYNQMRISDPRKNAGRIAW